MLTSQSRPARLQYLTNNFRILTDGDHVTCAVSGARIALDDLKYWSSARQEAYASAEAATEALAPR